MNSAFRKPTTILALRYGGVRGARSFFLLFALLTSITTSVSADSSVGLLDVLIDACSLRYFL